MSERRKSDWDFIEFPPPRLSRRARWIMGCLTALAVVGFLIGELLIKLGHTGAH